MNNKLQCVCHTRHSSVWHSVWQIKWIMPLFSLILLYFTFISALITNDVIILIQPIHVQIAIPFFTFIFISIILCITICAIVSFIWTSSLAILGYESSALLVFLFLQNLDCLNQPVCGWGNLYRFSVAWTGWWDFGLKKFTEVPRYEDANPFADQPSRHMVTFRLCDSISYSAVFVFINRCISKLCSLREATDIYTQTKHISNVCVIW